jgi:polyphosphate kinase 2 (PPK2 family)
MKIASKDFRVREGDKVNLKKWPTEVKPYYSSKKQLKKMLRAHVKEMSELQNLLYASNRYAVLLIFQGMDAAGKDSAIKHVMSGVNPQGCQVFSMRHASWYVVPADDKGNARLIISRIIIDMLRGLKMKYPTLSEKQRKELRALRRLLAK